MKKHDPKFCIYDPETDMFLSLGDGRDWLWVNNPDESIEFGFNELNGDSGLFTRSHALFLKEIQSSTGVSIDNFSTRMIVVPKNQFGFTKFDLAYNLRDQDDE